jgi:5'/3'-nucleotidase SurE
MINDFELVHTSDDGFLSKGSTAMIQEFENHNLNYVSVLPSENMSGMGGALGPLKLSLDNIRRIDKRCYVLDTTAVGCIRWALKGGIPLRSNVTVVSGINRGLNLLLDLPASGTVMSSLYAASRGHVGLAVSCGYDENTLPPFELAARISLKLIEEVNKFQSKLCSVNVPANPINSSWTIVRTPEEEAILISQNQTTIRQIGWKFNP